MNHHIINLTIESRRESGGQVLGVSGERGTGAVAERIECRGSSIGADHVPEVGRHQIPSRHQSGKSPGTRAQGRCAKLTILYGPIAEVTTNTRKRVVFDPGTGTGPTRITIVDHHPDPIRVKTVDN